MKAHKVYRVRDSVPGDPDHPKPPYTPRTVCADCGKAVWHRGVRRNGTPWAHGSDQ